MYNIITDLTVDGNTQLKQDLKINGSTVIDGDLNVGGVITFNNLTVQSLTVNGNSTLKNVLMTGNLSGIGYSATFNSFNVSGNTGIIQFNYNDPNRPNDIKSSIEPYKISTNDMQLRNSTTDYAKIGNVTFSKPGLVAAGKATIDYLDIIGNSTTGNSRPQLTVAGKTKLGDLEVTGTVTGFKVDLSSQDVTVKSLTSTGQIKGSGILSTGNISGTSLNINGVSSFTGDISVTGQTTTVRNLVVTGTTTGITTGGNVDGSDIKPKSVDVSTTLKVQGESTLGTIRSGTQVITGDETISGSLLVAGQSSVSNLTATGNITTASLIVQNGSSFDNINANRIVSPLFSGITIFDNNVNIQGTLTANSIDLSTTDVTAKSLSTTNNVTVGGDLSVQGNFDLSQVDLIAKSINTSQLSTFASLNSQNATIGTAMIDSLNVNGASTVQSLTSNGFVKAATIDTPSIGNTTGLTITSNVTANADFHIKGTLSLEGALDLSNVDLQAKSLHTTGDIVVGGTIDLTNSDITAKSIVISSSIKENILPILKSTTATITSLSSTNSVLGEASANTLSVTNNSTFSTVSTSGNVTVGGNLTVQGQFDLSSTNLQAQSLTSTATTTVGTDLILSTGNVVGSPKITGTLEVTGNTKVSTITSTGAATFNSSEVIGDLKVDGTSNVGVLNSTGLATVNALQVINTTSLNTLNATGNSTFGGTVTISTGKTTVQDLQVNGVFTPVGGFDISTADLIVNSITTTNDGTINGKLKVTGNTTLGVATINTLTTTGTSTLGVVNANTITTSGIITVNSNSNSKIQALMVGTGTPDNSKQLNVFGSATINGDLDVTGSINASIDLTSRDISPRNINASGFISTVGNMTVGAQLTAPNAIIGTSGSTNNNLQVNGNVVTSGNFTVSGLIIGTLDQSSSDVTVKSLVSTTSIEAGTTLKVTGTSTLASVNATNLVASGTLNVTGTSTLGNLNVSSALGVTGNTQLSTLTSTGLAILNSGRIVGTFNANGDTVIGTNSTNTLTVNANSNFIGDAVVNNLKVKGTLDLSAAAFSTNTFKTGTYYVTPHATETVSTASWTPDGTSNVYNLTLTANTNILPISGVNGAGSWFIYITQDSTGGRTVTWDSSYITIAGSISTVPNSVSICQIVYCGIGTKYDLFITQRP